MAKPKSGKTKLKRLQWQWNKYINNPKLAERIDRKITAVNKYHDKKN